MNKLTLSAAILGLVLSACVGDDSTSGTTGRVPGPSVAKAVCPTGCSDDVLQAIDESDDWHSIFDGTSTGLGNGRLSEYVSARIHDGTHLANATKAEDVCEVLPAEGACSLACDPAALAAQIPEGTCITFRCELLDGRVLLAGGCR